MQPLDFLSGFPFILRLLISPRSSKDLLQQGLSASINLIKVRFSIACTDQSISAL